MFKKIHDIYALRVALLEIGLWYPAVKVTLGGADQTCPKAAVVNVLEPRKYKEVVFKCLSGNFGVGNYKGRLETTAGFPTPDR